MKISYREGETYFHKVDPLSKFTWGIIISVFLMSQRDIKSVAVISIIILATAILGAKIPLFSYLKSVIILMIAGFWLILFQGIVRPGPGFEILNVHLSRFGLEIGLAIILRTIGLVAAALAFSTTTSPKKLSLAMMQMGMPYKFAHVAYLALRFLPLFEADLRFLLDAQKLRGISNGVSKFGRTFKAMLLTQIRRVDTTAIALETRAFGLYPDRTNLERVSINRRGLLLVLVTLLMIFIKALI